jgi:type VI protein secretion system component Hcp
VHRFWRKWLRVAGLLSGLAAAALPHAARADWAGFLQLDRVTGEASETNHNGWIDGILITSSGLHATNSPLSGAARAEQWPLRLTKLLDASSITLATNCATGTRIKYGVLDLANTNGTGTSLLRLNLTNLLVTQISMLGAGGGNRRPIEQVALLTEVTSWRYVQVRPGSGLPREYFNGLWNFASNSGGSRNLPAVFAVTGIRKTTGVELSWNAVAGQKYRLYAATSLTAPFAIVTDVTAASTGPLGYTMPATYPALFFVVEQLP